MLGAQPLILNIQLIFVFRSEEREKGWEFESVLAFSYGGLVNKRSFINNNIGNNEKILKKII